MPHGIEFWGVEREIVLIPPDHLVTDLLRVGVAPTAGMRPRHQAHAVRGAKTHTRDGGQRQLERRCCLEVMGRRRPLIDGRSLALIFWGMKNDGNRIGRML
jgi:hypothetical protein